MLILLIHEFASFNQGGLSKNWAIFSYFMASKAITSDLVIRTEDFLK